MPLRYVMNMGNSNEGAIEMGSEQGPLSKRVITPMSEAMVEEINDFRFEERCASQADAVRELIKRGLEAWRKSKKGGKS